jgi:ABC-type glycerol-3-phosphate transport system substrate-binding protein
MPDMDVSLVKALPTKDGAVLLGQADNGGYSLYKINFEDNSIAKSSSLNMAYIDTISTGSAGEVYITSKSETGETILTTIKDSGISSTILNLPDILKDAYIMQFYVANNCALVQVPGAVYTLSLDNMAVTELGSYSGDVKIASNLNDGFYIINTLDSETFIQVLDSSLTVLKTYEISQVFDSVFPCKADTPTVCVVKSNLARLVELDTSSFSDYANLLSSGSSSNGFVYISEDSFFTIDDGRPTVWSRNSNTQGLTVLTLATCSNLRYERATQLERAVSVFNQQSEKYNIEILDYSIYNSSEESYEGVDQLGLDIVAGKTPDIYDLWSMPSPNYGAQGLVEDLYPFFDSDEDIDMGSLFSSVFTTLDSNGKLYDLVPSFSITSVYCNKAILNSSGGLSSDDLIELSSEYSPVQLFGDDMSRYDFLTYLLVYSGDEYINMGTATCNFNTPTFVNMLEFSAQLPEEPRYETYEPARIYTGNQMILINTTDDLVYDWQFANALFCGNEALIGFPTNSSNGVNMAPSLRLGMSTNSQCKDGVWEFFKFLLSDSYQQIASGIRVRRDISERIIAAQVEAYKGSTEKIALLLNNIDGVTDGAIGLNDPPDWLKDKLLDYLDKIDGINEYDDKVLDILFQEANKYYAGQISAEQAAENIQSKVGIYVAEQYS